MLLRNSLHITEWFPGSTIIEPPGEKPSLIIPSFPLCGEAGWNNFNHDEAQLGDLWLISILHRALYVSEKFKQRYETVSKGAAPNFQGIFMAVRAEPSAFQSASTEVINGIPCKIYSFNFRVAIPEVEEQPHPFIFDLDRLLQEVE